MTSQPSNPALMSKDQLRELMFHLVREPGAHELVCRSHYDATCLRLRMNRIRTTERKRAVDERIKADPKTGKWAGDGFEFDQLVLTIAKDSPVLVVNVAPKFIPLDFVRTRQPDGTTVPTFPEGHGYTSGADNPNQPRRSAQGEEDLI